VSRDAILGDVEDDVELTEREKLMAQQLVESLASEAFDPSKYTDEYREQLLDLIQRKSAGEEIVAEPETEAPAKVLDLVAALEASLAKAGTAKERHPSTQGRKAGAADDDEAPAKPKKAPAKKAAKTAAKKAPAKKRAS
jgi:DNA end-binding protein Ku